MNSTIEPDPLKHVREQIELLHQAIQDVDSCCLRFLDRHVHDLSTQMSVVMDEARRRNGCPRCGYDCDLDTESVSRLA